MEGISGISGVAGGMMPVRMNPVAAPTTAPGAAAAPVGLPSAPGQAAPAAGASKTGQMAGLGAAHTSAAGSASATQEMGSLSSLSINQSSEMLMVSQAPQGAITSNELLGAVLLMLLMEYMKSTDDKEKQGLLALMGMILQAQQAQQNGGQQTLMYASSSLSIDSTQMQYMSGQAASNAYTNAGVNPAPGGTGGSGLNIVA